MAMDLAMEYQSNFTDNSVAKGHMYDGKERLEKAKKVVAVLRDYANEIESLSVLDISCSTGIITGYFAQHFHKVVGIDIDEEAVAYAKSNNTGTNPEFHVMDALNTEFPDNCFDVVVCNQMYEHVPDAGKLMKEICRILVHGGICYFGATNRLKVVETHYGRLPFLSYLPKPIANFYLKITGRGQYYYENLYTCRALKRLCAEFEIIDYTEKVVSQPKHFGIEDMLATGSMQQRLALLVLRYAYWLSPGYIWLLKKPASPTDS